MDSDEHIMELRWFHADFIDFSSICSHLQETLLLIIVERGDKYKLLHLVANILRIDLQRNIHSHLTVDYCSNVSFIIRFRLSTLIS